MVRQDAFGHLVFRETVEAVHFLAWLNNGRNYLAVRTDVGLNLTLLGLVSSLGGRNQERVTAGGGEWG